MEQIIQIARVDGKNCFVEVLNRAFPIGKVSINFIKYNIGNTKGSRIESEIHAYMDWYEFLYFADLVETVDSLCKRDRDMILCYLQKREQEKSNDNERR